MITSERSGNQPGMKRWTILAGALVALAAGATPRLELEVGGGATGVTGAAMAPALNARVGVDFWEHVTPSLKVLTALPLEGDTSWATLAELGVHTSGTVQVSASVGLGFGNAVLSAGDRKLDAQFFQVKPYLEGEVGARVMFGRFWVGLNVGALPLDRTLLASLNLGVSAFGGSED
jgi:hypothetical protein